MQRPVGQQIRIIVNGEAVETSAATLAELVAAQGFAETTVATALNGDFVPRQARAAAKLAADDNVEIVAPRQGG
ncbi:MAG TPA: sulfur carrier protein ThiS [Hyphomicrobiaceae bacterium]|nr:sulfur carrier protein ThiS [Hyphomicrobiaceae bacterium]